MKEVQTAVLNVFDDDGNKIPIPALGEKEGKYELIETVTLENDISAYTKTMPFPCNELLIFLTAQPTNLPIKRGQVNLKLYYQSGKSLTIAFDKGISEKAKNYSIARIYKHLNEVIIQFTSSPYKALQRNVQEVFAPQFGNDPIIKIELFPLETTDKIPKNSIIEIKGVRA